AEAPVETGGEWIRLQEPVAEAVDRRDPRAVELAGEIGATELEQPRANASAQLAGGPLGVRDDEDRGDVEPGLADRMDEPLDQHIRLPGAGARGDEDDPGRV